MSFTTAYKTTYVGTALIWLADGLLAKPIERSLHVDSRTAVFYMVGSALCIPLVQGVCRVFRQGLQHPAP